MLIKFSEDFNSGINLNGVELEEFYVNVKAGAESGENHINNCNLIWLSTNDFFLTGWDFSTRWFLSNNETDLSKIQTRQIAPVDLNAFICMNAQLLSEMFILLGDPIKAELYTNLHLEWKQTMQQVC